MEQCAEQRNRISIQPQTLADYDALCRGLVQDPLLFADPDAFRPYRYDPTAVAETFEKNRKRIDRRYFTVFLDDMPIGELVLKCIDFEQKSCEFGICLQSDAVKNRGYGTAAERLALRYAFETLGMETVYADALIRNRRSCHVLEKIGMNKIGVRGDFNLYRIDRAAFITRQGGQSR